MTDENSRPDARPTRRWRVPGWTWIFLHFVFVASLAFVDATSCPWVRRGRLPGDLEVANFDHGTALIKLESTGDNPEYALLDMATLNITRPVVDAEEAYGKSVFLPAERRAIISELDRLHDCLTYRVVDLDSGLAYPLLPELPFDSATLDGSGKRVFISSRFQTVPPDVARRTNLDVMTGERGGHGAWLPDDSGVVVATPDGRVMCRRQGKHADAAWTFRTGHTGPRSLALSPDCSYVATLPAFGGLGHLLDARSGTEIRRITVGATPVVIMSFRVAMFGLAGQRLIVRNESNLLHVTETVTGEVILETEWVTDTRHIAVSTGGKRLASLEHDFGRVIDIETGGRLAWIERDGDSAYRDGHAAYTYSDDFLVWGRDVYRRRFPEWWWGHLYRPEVWAAVGIGAAWLWSVVRWGRMQLKRRRAAQLSRPPA